MKKKMLECNIHGVTLHRCKRVCYQIGGKKKGYNDHYKEECFQCINEGKYKKAKEVKQTQKHVSLRD